MPLDAIPGDTNRAILFAGSPTPVVDFAAIGSSDPLECSGSYWDDAPVPDLVKTVPHVAFEVEDVLQALEGHRVIIEPDSPRPGVIAAFIELNGAAG